MKSISKILAVFLILTSATPLPMLLAPQRAEAAWPTFDAANVVQTTITAIQSSISAVANVAEQINSWMLVVKHWVLDPLAFVLSGNMLRSLTAGVIDFVNGKTNGIGSPQFVRGLQGHLLGVGDAQAFRFFSEYGRYSNSPFSATILSSLRGNYLQGTSRAGFWAANRCTLTSLSPNINAFLQGNFRQGGWLAWFSMTGDPRNNPYAQYYIAQAELSASVREATANTLQELSWGDGFMSWCGDQTAVNETPADGDDPLLVTITSRANCTKKDGAPGTIQTPGSVIRDGLQKALGTNIDKAVQMGDASADINSIFSNFASIMQTMSYGAAILGSVGGAGLFGARPSTGSIGSAASINSAFSNSRTVYGTQAIQQAQTEGTAGVAALTSGVLPPPPPNPTHTCNAGGTQVTLSWGAATGATSYNVRLNDLSNDVGATCSEGQYCPPKDIWNNIYPLTSITHAITPNQAYTWWVHAVNTAGEGSPSGGSFTCI